MPYTKVALQNLHTLSLEDVDATLNACGLAKDRDEYTDEEIQSGFDVIRGYFNDGQGSDYTAASELFKQQQSTFQQLEMQPQSATKKSGKGKKSSSSNQNGADLNKHLDTSELLSLASEWLPKKTCCMY